MYSLLYPLRNQTQDLLDVKIFAEKYHFSHIDLPNIYANMYFIQYNENDYDEKTIYYVMKTKNYNHGMFHHKDVLFRINLDHYDISINLIELLYIGCVTAGIL